MTFVEESDAIEELGEVRAANVDPSDRIEPAFSDVDAVVASIARRDSVRLRLIATPGRRSDWRYYVRRGKRVAIELTPRRFTAGEYHQMIEAGVFAQAPVRSPRRLCPPADRTAESALR